MLWMSEREDRHHSPVQSAIVPGTIDIRRTSFSLNRFLHVHLRVETIDFLKNESVGNFGVLAAQYSTGPVR